jgi:predicted metal-dependent HD superfamily phosphohydrolase
MVELALFFHDIVYVPSSKTNEKDSAAISGKFI